MNTDSYYQPPDPSAHYRQCPQHEDNTDSGNADPFEGDRLPCQCNEITDDYREEAAMRHSKLCGCEQCEER